MRHLKMLGLLGIAATVVMALASTALATTITFETKTYLPSGNTIHAEAGTTTLHGVTTITCHKSTLTSKLSSEGGSGITVKGVNEKLTFDECTNAHVEVNLAGTLEVHTDPDDNSPVTGNGILTSSGGEITVQITSLNLTCVFTTSNTVIGTIEGSETHSATGVLKIESSKIPRTGGSIFCGSSAEWTGNYIITTPHYLYVD